MKYKWKYGENNNQKYYDVTVGKDYLCVFANKWNPNTWLGMYNSICIHNKTKNDRVRKKQGLAKSCCIFRKNRALAPHERSAVPLGTDHCPVG